MRHPTKRQHWHQTQPNLLPFEGEMYFMSAFFEKLEADTLLQELTETTTWKQEPITIMGKPVMQPRLTAWYGAPGKSYSYSGITMYPDSWSEALSTIRSKVEELSGCQFNSALLNFYRDGNDSMGWHRDNEKSLGPSPTIASVSFRAIRKFGVRYAKDIKTKIELQLTHGSLVLMKGAMQHYWYHSIPKQRKISTPRINITFRKIII